MTKTIREVVVAHAVKLEAIHEDVLEIKQAVLAQNGRVRKLEHHRSWLAGGLSLLGFLLGLGILKIFGV